MPKIELEEVLETLLAREIQAAIDAEVVQMLIDPTYQPDLAEMTFESEEDKKAYLEHFQKIVNRPI